MQLLCAAQQQSSALNSEAVIVGKDTLAHTISAVLDISTVTVNNAASNER